MKDYLFKGKRKDNGEWVSGDLLKQNGKAYIITDFEFQDDYGEGTDLITAYWFEVDPKTVYEIGETGSDENHYLIWGDGR